MGEILGIGATHYPSGLVTDEYKPWPLARMLQGDRIPDYMKDPANWPEPIRQEWGQQEVLNWFCLVGAMSELGRKTEILEWAETWTFIAPKCMTVFRQF